VGLSCGCSCEMGSEQRAGDALSIPLRHATEQSVDCSRIYRVSLTLLAYVHATILIPVFPRRLLSCIVIAVYSFALLFSSNPSLYCTFVYCSLSSFFNSFLNHISLFLYSFICLFSFSSVFRQFLVHFLKFVVVVDFKCHPFPLFLPDVFLFPFILQPLFLSHFFII
jgi:hypothetical protein